MLFVKPRLKGKNMKNDRNDEYLKQKRKNGPNFRPEKSLSREK